MSDAKPPVRDPSPDAQTPRERKVAVALHYDPGAAATPRIVATGRGALAEQILSIAFAAGVRVREDADLAEILAKVDVDSEIPIEALAAVAEILAYVYRLNAMPVPALPPVKGGA